ncbi:D-Ala-D-Ala carboxypeptidase family metallohydrolase [Maribacter halichondriae]|uniref:D-Ala-D-Ala carboxypeptidase family metallohydrolase n=1 Tax=Maribacter halichondriae TaxID=2980554 RepID=UPI002359E787|nr:D-Ala-D-Ala carboxypeptidase family metallohydrolase [Maribacter sp. Hal144]
MRISKNISYREAVRSNTAKRWGIWNTPKPEIIENMRAVAKNIFQPLREANGNRPIRINSFFRSRRLNKVLGGSTKSQHILGQAIDIDDTHGGMSNAEMFYWIVYNLNFDQVIWEFGTDENPDWVHVSYVNPELNRHSKLRARRSMGKTVYEVLT